MRAYLAQFDSSESFFGYFTQFESNYTPDLNPFIYPYPNPKMPADDQTDRHKIEKMPADDRKDGKAYYTVSQGIWTRGLWPNNLHAITVRALWSPKSDAEDQIER